MKSAAKPSIPEGAEWGDCYLTDERGVPAAACPYCGEPKDRHAYASPTSCVLGGFPPTKIESAATIEPHNSVTPFRAWYEKNPLSLRVPTREEAESRV